MSGLIEAPDIERYRQIDAVAKDAQRLIIEAEESGDRILKAVVMSRAINKLRQLLDGPVLDDLLELQGSSLGFRTDKDGAKGYPREIVRDVAIEAILRGFRMVGNEINIIAGRLYATKEGFERCVREWPGISNIEIELGAPEIKGDSAYIPGQAEWKMGGKFHGIHRHKTAEKDLRIIVRVNNGMGPDAILGKARSKLYRLIHERLCGIITLDPEEPGDPEVIDPVADTVVFPKIETTAAAPSLAAWGEYEPQIIESLSLCTDRDLLEKAWKQWVAYAHNKEKKQQLEAAFKAKAAELDLVHA